MITIEFVYHSSETPIFRMLTPILEIVKKILHETTYFSKLYFSKQNCLMRSKSDSLGDFFQTNIITGL